MGVGGWEWITPNPQVVSEDRVKIAHSPSPIPTPHPLSRDAQSFPLPRILYSRNLLRPRWGVLLTPGPCYRSWQTSDRGKRNDPFPRAMAYSPFKPSLPSCTEPRRFLPNSF